MPAAQPPPLQQPHVEGPDGAALVVEMTVGAERAAAGEFGEIGRVGRGAAYGVRLQFLFLVRVGWRLFRWGVMVDWRHFE